MCKSLSQSPGKDVDKTTGGRSAAMRVSSPGPSEYDSDKPIAARSLVYDKRFAA